MDSTAHAHCRSIKELMGLAGAIVWIIQVHQKFDLMPESLYLTFHIIDRYVSIVNEVRASRELYLVGDSALLIACKY
jgi:hypothetical protein